MKLGDTVLTLNRSAQVIQGVELSKNQTGVTASLMLSNYTASVFFDGYTAQIHLQGNDNKNIPLLTDKTWSGGLNALEYTVYPSSLNNDTDLNLNLSRTWWRGPFSAGFVWQLQWAFKCCEAFGLQCQRVRPWSQTNELSQYEYLKVICYQYFLCSDHFSNKQLLFKWI